MSIKKLSIELIIWEDVRRECKYPLDDNNEGYIFGIEFIDDESMIPLDAQWFKTESDMYKFINGNELKIIKKDKA